MKSNSVKKARARRIWIPIMLIAAIAAGGAGYYTYNQQQTAAQTSATETLNTSTVKEGSITISVSGSGTLVASQEKALAFSTTGTVTAVNAQVGDVVKKGEVLATIDGQDTIQAEINSDQQDLITAQSDLQTLKDNAAANIANAQLALATAQKAVIDSKSSVIQPGMAPCDSATIDSYYYKYTQAKAALDALGNGGGNYDYYLSTIVPAKNKAAAAYSTYESCIKFTDYEITSSQATYSLDQAKLKAAQDTLDTLNKNNGLDPVALATAQNKVDSAQLALDQAKAKLVGTAIISPIDGTVLSVAGSVGDSAGTSTFITVADLANPQVQFSIDETDMDKVSIGEEANVTFDALPDTAFTGKVIRINPALVTSGQYNVMQGLIQLDLSKAKNPPALLKGMTGTVELVQASAKNVLLVPLQAVRDLGDGQYGVFVVGADGKTTLKFVTVGLMDAASAEIKTGLTAGEVVSTGSAATK